MTLEKVKVDHPGVHSKKRPQEIVREQRRARLSNQKTTSENMEKKRKHKSRRKRRE